MRPGGAPVLLSAGLLFLAACAAGPSAGPPGGGAGPGDEGGARPARHAPGPFLEPLAGHRGPLGPLAPESPPGPESEPPSDPRAEPPQEVTLEEVLAFLRARSPRLAAERERTAAARADLAGARALPNPTLSAEGLRRARGADTIDGGESTYELEMPVPILGQRRARIRSARQQLRVAGAEVAAEEAWLAREARLVFTSLLAAQARLELLEAARDDLERVERVVLAELEAGTRSPYDLLRTRIELAALDTELSEARRGARDLAGHLAALLGLGDWLPRAVGELARPMASLDPAELWPQAEARLAVLELARREDEAARAEVELARRERLPVPELRVGLHRTRDEFSESYLAGIALPLPLFDRGQGPLGRARAEARAARLRLGALLGEARAELARAAAQLAERRAALERFEREVAAAMPDLREMAELSYTTGGTGIFELLDSLQALKDLRLAELELIEGAALAEIEALWAAGLLDAGP